VFSPERLIVARERRGLSRSGLAEKAELAEKSIRNYESGEDLPRAVAIDSLASALGVPVEFFDGPPLEGLGEDAASFRAATKLPAYRRRAALAAGSFAMHFANFIATEFVLPPVGIPHLEGYEPELAAEAVRGSWGLGSGPAPNMVHLLEAHGAFVFALAEDCRELDAYSFWRWDRPFVALNTIKSAERSRLDAAHELAHLVLHRNLTDIGKVQEDEAQSFAGAFLMPRAAVLASGVRGAGLTEILSQKKTWRVSATSYTRRLHQLGLISDWQYRSLMIELTKRGYRSGEPDGLQREGSQLIQMVLAELRTEGVGLPKLAKLLSISVDDLRSMVLGLASVNVV
jgi:Zn-dependent peptidase ImmA (M78 family)/transcriptional regulator with XRE-family HTH domain